MSNKRKNRRRKGTSVRIPWRKYLFDEFWNRSQEGRLFKAAWHHGRSLARRMAREQMLLLEKILK